MTTNLVDHGEDAEPAAVQQQIRGKLRRPAMVRRFGNTIGPRMPSARLCPSRLCAHRQPSLAVNAEQRFVVQPNAFPCQKDVPATIAEASALCGQFAQLLLDCNVIRSARSVTIGLCMQPN